MDFVFALVRLFGVEMGRIELLGVPWVLLWVSKPGVTGVQGRERAPSTIILSAVACGLNIRRVYVNCLSEIVTAGIVPSLVQY